MFLGKFKSIMMVALASVAFSLADANAATLTGDTVTGSIEFGGVTAQGPANAVVGAGVEFDFNNADIDVGSSSISIFNILTGSVLQDETYLVADLDFSGSTSLLSATFTGFSGLSASPLLDFGSDFVSVTLASGTFVSSGAFINVSLSAVPLPAAGWLLIAGLGGLGALRRRHATKT